jgi:hypothetical protein
MKRPWNEVNQDLPFWDTEFLDYKHQLKSLKEGLKESSRACL